MVKNTKYISITAMGVALFVVLTLCLQVPVFENYYLCLGYIVMMLYCYSIGVFSGTIVGTLGVVLYCLLINGLRGMPGWALGNIVIGIIIGIAFQFTKKLKSSLIEIVMCIIAAVIATAIGILGVKSIVECFLYSQPFLIRVASNMYAFIADVFVIGISIPVCRQLDPYITKLIKK